MGRLHVALQHHRQPRKAADRRSHAQYGGFCSYGISHESQWTSTNLGPNTNPDTWQILHGKLYMFMYGLPMGEFMDGEVETRLRMPTEVVGLVRWRWRRLHDGDHEHRLHVVL